MPQAYVEVKPLQGLSFKSILGGTLSSRDSGMFIGNESFNGLATGAGIAVLGVFSLVRFRSQPGSSREILAIMLSMAIGLACGGGYITFAVFAAAVVCIVWLILFSTPFGDNGNKKELRIEIPENLDYEGLFDDIFKEFTTKNEVITVKTVQMGSVYELRYHISLKRDKSEKAFIDAIRARNGNLPVSCGRVKNDTEL